MQSLILELMATALTTPGEKLQEHPDSMEEGRGVKGRRNREDLID
jgi:hypothetical protein